VNFKNIEYFLKKKTQQTFNEKECEASPRYISTSRASWSWFIYFDKKEKSTRFGDFMNSHSNCSLRNFFIPFPFLTLQSSSSSSFISFFLFVFDRQYVAVMAKGE